jgi:hypothetical protein
MHLSKTCPHQKANWLSFIPKKQIVPLPPPVWGDDFTVHTL